MLVGSQRATSAMSMWTSAAGLVSTACVVQYSLPPPAFGLAS
jgi:hypothetical protein